MFATQKFITTMKRYFILSMILGMTIGYGSRHAMEVQANDNLSIVLDGGKKDKKNKKANKDAKEGEAKDGEKKGCKPAGAGGCCHGKKAS
jgi:hypothetical protein